MRRALFFLLDSIYMVGSVFSSLGVMDLDRLEEKILVKTPLDASFSTFKERLRETGFALPRAALDVYHRLGSNDSTLCLMMTQQTSSLCLLRA